MTIQEFHNAMRTLANIDGWELRQAGMSHDEAAKFCREPHMRFISMPDRERAMVWQIVEQRQQTARAA